MPDTKLSILVVDDDFATRLLACEALMAEGFETSEAEDGEDALRQLETARHDVLLVDINMPGISGYDVCRAVRQRPDGDAFSILVMTASDDVEAVEMAFSSGATDFMTKPLNLPLLGRRVRFMLRAAEATRAAREAASRLTRAQQLAQVVNFRVGRDATFAWESDPYGVLWPEAPPAHARLPLLELVHPADRYAILPVLSSPMSAEARLLLPDGSERVVRVHSEMDGETMIGAAQDITATKQFETQIEQLAFYDDLTGIPNHQFLTRYLARGCEDPLAAICIELGTCNVAATLGGAGRDMLLRAAASRVLERVRGEDTRLRLDQIPCAPEMFDGVTTVARISTDELCVLTSAVGSAQQMLRQLTELFARPFTVADQVVTLTPRFGFAAYPDPVDDVRDVCDRARTALQEAQPRAPRNVVVFGPVIGERRRLHDRLVFELGIELDADRAGEPTTLTATYEKRNDPSGRIVGARAVVSWPHLADNPAKLAELVALPTLANRVARWLIPHACADARRWLAAGRSVNLAIPVPFRAVTALHEVLPQMAGFPARSITLELTGPAPTGADRTATIAVLEELRAQGIRVVRADLDERARLADMVGLPLDGVNLSFSLVASATRAEIAATMAICHALHFGVSVSQVGSPAQLLQLEGLDVTEVSGPVIGPFPLVEGAARPRSDSGLFEVRFRSM